MKYKLYYVDPNPDKKEPACILVEIIREDGKATVHFNPVETFKDMVEGGSLEDFFDTTHQIEWSMAEYKNHYPDDVPRVIDEVDTLKDLIPLIKCTMLVME